MVNEAFEILIVAICLSSFHVLHLTQIIFPYKIIPLAEWLQRPLRTQYVGGSIPGSSQDLKIGNLVSIVAVSSAASH